MLYLSVSKTAGEMHFEAIVMFNSATNVDLKIMEHNINYETTITADIFTRLPLMTTVFRIMTISQLLVRSHLTARRVFRGDYSIGLT